MEYYYLYRLNSKGEAEIYGKFELLSAAKLSASLLKIEDVSFILSGDISKIYFYEDGNWDYDLFTYDGKSEFLRAFPDPREYK